MFRMRSFFTGWMFAFVLISAPVAHAADESKTLLATVKDFYLWALQNTEALKQLEPKIEPVAGGPRRTLDAGKADAYAAKFVTSGFFHPQDFPRNVRRYYTRVQNDLKVMTDAEFADIERDGGAVLMETEDMDPLFCAQEYEYDPEFVDEMKISNVTVTGSVAHAVIVSSYEWETVFTFKKVNRRWIITGFCVFQQQEE